MNPLLLSLTVVHVIISLVGIATGLIVVYGFLTNKQSSRWTNIFLVTTVATSATGFLFPFERVLPSHITGIVSLIVLAPTLYALYGRRLAARWRGAYVIGSVLALYLNVFVLVVQLFLKIPPLKALAPTQSEPPFKIAQGVVFLAFVILGVLSFRKFRPQISARASDSPRPVILPQSRISNG